MKKFTYPVAKNAQAEAYRKIFDEGYTYEGWEIKLDSFNGVVEWSKPGTDCFIYATPHYHEENVVPVTIYCDDDYDYLMTINLNLLN